MKRLLKIGTLLLFMIGFCIVQTGYSTPVLVDDDVGVEFVTNVDVLDDAMLTIIIINPGQVASPLKHPLVEVQTNSIKVIKGVVYAGDAIRNDYTVNRQLINKTNKLKGCLISAPEQIIINGLFRLDIGERF